jgi:hypothetical protein
VECSLLLTAAAAAAAAAAASSTPACCLSCPPLLPLLDKLSYVSQQLLSGLNALAES